MPLFFSFLSQFEHLQLLCFVTTHCWGSNHTPSCHSCGRRDRGGSVFFKIANSNNSTADEPTHGSSRSQRYLRCRLNITTPTEGQLSQRTTFSQSPASFINQRRPAPCLFPGPIIQHTHAYRIFVFALSTQTIDSTRPAASRFTGDIQVT
jgi:hypothetical protein